MKKVGIITIHDHTNYGNRLQNYATQEVLKSLGCEPITIVNHVTKKNIDKSVVLNLLSNMNLNKLMNAFSEYLIRVRKKVYLTNKEKEIHILNEKKEINFELFDNNNIRETNYVISESNIPSNINSQFDYFIVGSDQVWNPGRLNVPNMYFLTFASTEKRIAYAASFGVSALPDAYIENYKNKLSQFKYITVREEKGAEIIYDLMGRDVEVLVDPTLMLSKRQWLSISKKSKYKPTKPYLLIYFLGYLSEQVYNTINSLSKEFDLEVVALADINDELRYTTTGPSEFIDYINNAEIILTDSFHGTVFSMIFEKPFITFDRLGSGVSMSSRIDTLLGKFELEDRKWENVKDTQKFFDVSYLHIPQILEQERSKAINYLKNALNIKED